MTRVEYHTNRTAVGFSEVSAYTGARADGSVVVAFRGTRSTTITGWLLNINLTPMPIPGCAGCRVHSGFFGGWLALRGQVLASLSALNASKAPAITITGHSLGAALANIAALDLMTNYNYTNLATLYNFGQPRVGNAAYADVYEAVVTNSSGSSSSGSGSGGSSSSGGAAHLRGTAATSTDGPSVRAYRVVNAGDPVPHLPPRVFGYRHSPMEVWYRDHDHDSDRDSTNTSSFVLCSASNGEDPACSNSELELDIDDHLVYLGQRVTELC